MTQEIQEKVSSWAAQRYQATAWITIMAGAVAFWCATYGLWADKDYNILNAVFLLAVWLFIVPCRLYLIRRRNHEKLRAAIGEGVRYSDWAVKRWLVTIWVSLFGYALCLAFLLVGYLSAYRPLVLLGVLTLGFWFAVSTGRMAVVHYKNKKTFEGHA